MRDSGIVEQAAAERRKSRKLITRRDQELLNRVRAVFRERADSDRRIGPPQLGELLGVREPELAAAILRALCPGGQASIGESELRQAVIGLVLAEEEARLAFVFRLHDADGDGALGGEDLASLLQASVRQSRISLTPREMRGLSAALLSRADRNGDGRIDHGEFLALLDGFPLVRNELSKGVSPWFRLEEERRKRRRARGGLPRRLSGFLFGVLPHLANRYLLAALYLAANLFLFARAVQAYAAEGAPPAIQLARGAGACLNLNGALILLPVMRGWLTRLRRSPLAFLLPLDQHIDLHKLLGHVLLGFPLLHAAAHLVNYASLGTPLARSLLGTPAGLSGLALLAAFLLMWALSTHPVRRSRRFELFFFSHLLYLVWFAVALLHAPSFWKWALAPLLLFAGELAFRRFKASRKTRVREVELLPAGVTHLKLERPEGFAFRPGDFLFLKIPALSRFEWHPFTISSAPEQADHLGLHIRGLGNWTRELHERFARLDTGRVAAGLPAGGQRLPVLVHGPYGTPSGEIFRSRIAVLVGAGIGVTPFASILRSLMLRRESGLPLGLEKVYFYWLNSGQESFGWFTDLLARLETRGMSDFLELSMYLTGARIDPTSGLMKIGMDLLGRRDRRDLTTGLKTITSFGRPDWEGIFAQLARRHGYGAVKVFFCGPYPLAQRVRWAARGCGFRFRKENF